ncbi:NADP-dependent oxidoreductase [Parachryseolinea silvisoli]|uniref:NADP-dependent oxidoreductase n=1 Tax=Parachryseolinea silvisoli TaxID=2873601 RepID=UPI002265BE45|nr:NADP-dependent oxidoreductase [Parachryseolinea silvisoli]MCD9019704.1 NADP-dependent oxidoreductase [Parachryseolinea silvisoli]
MKAFIVNRYGKKEKLQLAEIAEPVVKETEILVQIHSAGVNLLDSKIRNGEFKMILPYKPPFVLGHDVAGVVTKVGSNVSKFKVGDEVYARPADHRIGAFAEFISINENDVAIKPKKLTMDEAASIPLVGLTVWQALIEKANLKKGQKVFIQAGSGGVGTFAIQLAKHLGATVATTTSATNIDLVKSLGADVVIDYKKDNFETMLNGYDVVLNSQDQKTLEKSLQVLKPGGKLISISGPPDIEFAKKIKAPWYVQLIMKLLSSGVKKKAKRLNVGFSFLFMRAQGRQLSKITSLIDLGVIRPVIDKVFPFEATNEAIAYVESGRAKGKVVIKIVKGS